MTEDEASALLRDLASANERVNRIFAIADRRAKAVLENSPQGWGRHVASIIRLNAFLSAFDLFNPLIGEPSATAQFLEFNEKRGGRRGPRSSRDKHVMRMMATAMASFDDIKADLSRFEEGIAHDMRIDFVNEARLVAALVEKEIDGKMPSDKTIEASITWTRNNAAETLYWSKRFRRFMPDRRLLYLELFNLRRADLRYKKTPR